MKKNKGEDMQLKDLKKKTAEELLSYAEELEVEDAASLRTQDLMYAVLKRLAETENTCKMGLVFCVRQRQIT